MSKPPRKRGFAALPPEKLRELASAGGRAVKKENRGFFRNRKLAQVAGMKGGQALKPEQRFLAGKRELAAELGRKGAKASAEARRKRKEARKPGGGSRWRVQTS